MKKNIFIIILSFLVVGLAGFIAYDNFFAEKGSKETSCTTQVSDTKEESKEKTADERYKAYLENLTKSIEENYGTDDEGGIRQYSRVKSITYDLSYSIEINKNGELLLTYDGDLNSKFNNYKLSDDVVSFYLTYYGNGGYQSLHYIKSNGEVHSASIEQIQDDGTIKDTKIDVKNIVEIKSMLNTDENGIGGYSTVYIDIDGNVIDGNELAKNN